MKVRLAIANEDGADHLLDDAALFVGGHSGPVGMKVEGLSDELFAALRALREVS